MDNNYSDACPRKTKKGGSSPSSCTCSCLWHGAREKVGLTRDCDGEVAYISCLRRFHRTCVKVLMCIDERNVFVKHVLPLRKTRNN